MKFLSALALLALPNLAQAACNAPPLAALPLSQSRNKLFVPVGIDGSPEQIAVDTGAGVTVVSTETANRLNILHDFDNHSELGGVGGADSILYIGKVHRFDIGPLHLEHQNFPIVDLPMRTESGAPVAGLLGADILHAFDVEIDIPRGRLAMWRADTCNGTPPSWADDVAPVPIDLDPGHHVLLPMRINGVDLTAILDTGAGAMTMTTRAAMRTGLTEDALEEDPELHGTGVNNRAWTGRYHRFDKISIGGVTFFHVAAGIVPSRDVLSYNSLGGADALFGVDLLRQTRLFISYRNRKLYMQSIDTGSD